MCVVASPFLCSSFIFKLNKQNQTATKAPGVNLHRDTTPSIVQVKNLSFLLIYSSIGKQTNKQWLLLLLLLMLLFLPSFKSFFVVAKNPLNMMLNKGQSNDLKVQYLLKPINDEILEL